MIVELFLCVFAVCSFFCQFKKYVKTDLYFESMCLGDTAGTEIDHYESSDSLLLILRS